MDCLLALGPFIKIGHFFFSVYLHNDYIRNLGLCLKLAILIPSMLLRASRVKRVSIATCHLT